MIKVNRFSENLGIDSGSGQDQGILSALLNSAMICAKEPL